MSYEDDEAVEKIRAAALAEIVRREAAEARCAELEKALRDIEMETRDGGQWGTEEINECASKVLICKA